MDTRLCPLCGQSAELTYHSQDLLVTVHCYRCGRYDTEYSWLQDNSEYAKKSSAYILSGLTRRAHDAGNRLTITGENTDLLLDSVSTSVLDQMNRCVEWLSRVQQGVAEYVTIHPDKDYPVVIARNRADFVQLIQWLQDEGLVEGNLYIGGQGDFHLTPNGWRKVEELRRTQPDSDQAFVAMWFDEKLNDVYNHGFKPALEATGFKPMKVDEEEHNGKIDDLIIAEIRRSGLVVADFTDNRGGVYFEAGFAMGLAIPVIWTCRDTDIDAVHFDTRQYNHIVWKDAEDLLIQLERRIEATIPGRAVRRG